jgi:tRNA(His) 5'-end guanylyltransferase
MRVFETAHDQSVLPGLHIVARLDGRDFTRLTKGAWDSEKPFDARFRDLMVETTRHLMERGFRRKRAIRRTARRCSRRAAASR